MPTCRVDRDTRKMAPLEVPTARMGVMVVVLSSAVPDPKPAEDMLRYQQADIWCDSKDRVIR